MTRSVADIIAEALPDYAPADPMASFTEDQRIEHDRLARRMTPGAALAVMRDRIKRRESAASLEAMREDADAIVADARSSW